ncbi:hypothetical protein PFICI_09885 [Pestalotiopsis fici W106-1]|uniref:Uncharacterized protein n=1 Tax=Pestalotiopsis fici (strain W106-1 / CGMCC3.15140) TaxID=1229662 RepID=W3WVC6_PESFW|nr:uncharacterized protein PFICI_09885 [Pestalotiopsis fici W106-1]ETS77823.1 hypothetical protein PFICI_09885 [Pestalotiopsis fici W106-1]
MPSYIPPHRRSQQGSKGSEPDAASSPLSPSNRPESSPRNFGDFGKGARGSTGSHFGTPQGRGRGGRSGHGTRPEPQWFDHADVITASDIFHHFQDDRRGATGGTTLHASKSRPNELVYVFLFDGANPRWDGDKIIFAKSNLGLLPEVTEHVVKHGPWDVSAEYRKSRSEEEALPEDSDSDDATEQQYMANTDDAPASKQFSGPLEGTNKNSSQPPAPNSPSIVAASTIYSDRPPELPSIPPIDYNPRPHEPIAVFQDVRGSAKFVFDGWYNISRVNIIAPRSAELVRLQSQKWERRDRFGNLKPMTKTRETSAWKSSLRHQWAVIKFEKLGPEVAPPPPSIEKRKEPASSSVPEKSVTEMLQEMRMKDSPVEHVLSEHDDSKHGLIEV